MMSSKEILTIQNLGDLGYFLSHRRVDYPPTEAEVTHVLKLCNALWLHSGDLSRPHVELTTGDCSNGFVDVLRALCYTDLCEFFARHLAGKVLSKLEESQFEEEIEWVVGSDHAGAALSHSVAAWFGVRHDFTEKAGPDGKEQVWRRFAVAEHEPVLQIEDLVTSARTLLAVRYGMRDGNANPISFVPVVGALVHRSDVYEIEGAPIVYLVHYDIVKWKQEECPLCAAGSERVRPKSKENWAKLTA